MTVEETILVTGGGGYIGSHVVLALQAAGYTPVIFDNFSRCDRSIVTRLGVPIVEGDIRDAGALRKAFESYPPSGVMHFAALTYVEESVRDPRSYYENNVVGTLTLLGAMVEYGVSSLIFSSTAATYGIPEVMPITEDTAQAPVNPYGQTKLIIERALRDYYDGYGIGSISFRYFNAAGADPDGRIGECHDPETHLIPLIVRAAMTGKSVFVNGTDYPTKDGTCVRDYIHVADIAAAHLLGLKKLRAERGCEVFNIGNGSGHSIREVIDSVRRVSGKEVPCEERGRRAGDPPVLIASSEKLQRDLGWSPQFANLDDIVKTAWKWHSRS